jgi:UDP-glucose 4-epimerase
VKLLVTGGAGYIGSVVAAKLVAAGHDVTVLDDLSTGRAEAIPKDTTFVYGTLRDDAKLALGDGTDAVLHFAAKSLVGESHVNPAKYWAANLGGTLALLDAMRMAGTKRLVFSSTSAVYGEPESVPITEAAPTRPTNPYGASKLAVDTTLTEHARMYGFGAVSLRYFNVAGAFRAADGSWLGDEHDPEAHLFPNILGIRGVAAAGGVREAMTIHGDDYPTPDGTCIRDYIHVSDLADAHLLALGACELGEHKIYNLGNEAGFSVRQVIDMCSQVTGRDIPAVAGSRRPGDPSKLIASSARIHTDLGWRPARDLRDMVADHWQFTQARAALRAAVSSGEGFSSRTN